jgi:hypothetical protein
MAREKRALLKKEWTPDDGGDGERSGEEERRGTRRRAE